MTHIQTYMMLGCIVTNLVAGNLFLCLPVINKSHRTSRKPNFRLMISASIACVICYLFLFAKVQPATHNLFLLWLLSLATCFAIAIIGNIIAGILQFGAKSIGAFLLNIFTGLLTGFAGALIFSPFIIPVSIVNVVWLAVFVRNMQ